MRQIYDSNITVCCCFSKCQIIVASDFTGEQTFNECNNKECSSNLLVIYYILAIKTSHKSYLRRLIMQSNNVNSSQNCRCRHRYLDRISCRCQEKITLGQEVAKSLTTCQSLMVFPHVYKIFSDVKVHGVNIYFRTVSDPSRMTPCLF